MRLSWLTDLHLNFVSLRRRKSLYQAIQVDSPDALIVTGDWAEADSLVPLLSEWQTELNLPTYFVLGNHDFYHGDFETTRVRLNHLLGTTHNLHYLTQSPVISLNAQTALIGHDSWADARFGNFFLSPVRLNDHHLIADLRNLPPKTLYNQLNALGDQAATFLAAQLKAALANHQRVLLATHVPPYREACWHNGRISDDDWIPHFACAAVGQALSAIMATHPHHTLTVYCGHTHSSGIAQILPNLTVHTGSATYGEPTIQQLIHL